MREVDRLAFAVPAGAQPVSETFVFTGASEEFVVPANVCELAVDAFGAAGGDGDVDSQVSGTGGLGGRAAGVVAVTPGESVQVFVGGAGGNAPAAG